MILTHKNLQKLIQEQAGDTRLSIYVPTHPSSSSQSISQDRLRFKNTLQGIKSDESYDERELGKTMRSLERLLADSMFWKHQSLGLAIFADKAGYESILLPHGIAETQFVKDHFIVSPLAIMLSIGTGYYVLDINLTRPRLLHFTAFSQYEVYTGSMPGSFAETVGRDEYQKQLQHQAIDGNMFHGHSEDEALAADTARYFKLIAKSVDGYLGDQDQPLLLAGTQNRIGHMRPLLAYDNVLKEAIEGNHEDLNEQQLRDATDVVIGSIDAPNHTAKVSSALDAPVSHVAIGKGEIESAVNGGRVATLFLSCYKKTEDGARSGAGSSITVQLPDDIESIESLVRGALSQGGSVVAVEQGSFDNDEPRALLRF